MRKVQLACKREVKGFKDQEKKILSFIQPMGKVEEVPYISLNTSENMHVYQSLSKQN